jgi:histidinol-phosphatase (PHP family)
MPWVNYHSHSLFCDGKAAPEDFVKAAIRRGFQAYGCSSHSPVPFPSKWNMDAGRIQEYLDEISRIRSAYKDIIQVYSGLEVDYIEGYSGYAYRGLKGKGLDYTIGSVHYIGYFPDGSGFCFDGPPETFFRSIEQLYQNDFHKALKRYYQNVRLMVENDSPDIIGHLDKIKMHNTVKPYFREDEEWYRNEVEETLDLIAEKGCVVEVNTRGFYKHNPPVLYPGRWVLEQIFRRKIPVMLNSDAHHPDEIELGFSFAAEILKETGYRTLRVLLDNEWQDKPFSEQGLEN